MGRAPHHLGHLYVHMASVPEHPSSFDIGHTKKNALKYSNYILYCHAMVKGKYGWVLVPWRERERERESAMDIAHLGKVAQ